MARPGLYIKRTTIEVDLTKYTFSEGDTPFSFAQRMLSDFGIDGTVLGISLHVGFLEVQRFGIPHPVTTPDEQMLEIEYIERKSTD